VIHKKDSAKKITANFLPHCRSYIQKYGFEGENAIDNSADKTSSGTLVTVNPLLVIE